jgi:hypothetical protein
VQDGPHVVGGPGEIIDSSGRLSDAGMDHILVSDVPGLARPSTSEAP